MIKKETVLSIIACEALSSAIALGIYYSFSYYKYYELLNAQHYNSKLTEPTSWLGPKIGEKLDISKLQDENGRFIKDNLRGNLLMLLIIDPKCYFCGISTDQMREVEKQIKPLSADFAVASFDPSLSVDSLLEFNETAKLNSKFYAFRGEDPKLMLQFPVYILTDVNGTILRVFAGSHEDDEVRKVMSKEIINGVNEEKSSLK